MESTRLQQHFIQFISQHIQAGQHIRLGLSGGMDSIVLLHLLVQASKQHPFTLSAMHVNHGISPNAHDWAVFCANTCQALQVEYSTINVMVDKNSGLGIEATARQERYKSLLQEGADFIALAHHQDDQAETLLLQLLRGAGSKGLAAMAQVDKSKKLLRPLLDVSRQDISQYALDNGLKWIEDESNQDIHYQRNYIRHQVMQVLETSFPACKKTIARASANLAEDAILLEELAEIDAKVVVQEGQILLSALEQYSELRAKNLLRWWLRSQQLLAPNAARLQEIYRQLMTAKQDANLKIALDSAKNIWLRRYQGLVYIEKRYAKLHPVAWQGEKCLQLSDGSELVFEAQLGRGISQNKILSHQMTIQYRNGGEQFKPHIARPSRSLKHLLQEAGIPPWLRERIPLIYCNDALVAIPDIGIRFDMQAAPDEMGLVLSWVRK